MRLYGTQWGYRRPVRHAGHRPLADRIAARVWRFRCRFGLPRGYVDEVTTRCVVCGTPVAEHP